MSVTSLRVVVLGQIEVRLPCVSGGQRGYVVSPGDDVSGCPIEVQDLAAEIWTPEVIAAWEAAGGE